MNKPFSTNTNKINLDIVRLVAKQDELKMQYGLRLLPFAHGITDLPPYDETNQLYKEYEEAELKANQFINQNTEIPEELKNYLLNTKEERSEWHEYCRTHYRKPKGVPNLENLFD